MAANNQPFTADSGVSTPGNISAAGNITGGNVSVTGNLVVGNLSLGGNGITSTNAGNVQFNGNVVITANLEVLGTTTSVDTQTLVVDNTVAVFANSATSPSTANGAGFQIGNAGYASMTYAYNIGANGSWVLSLSLIHI